MALHDILTGFADALLASDDPTEGVELEVTRVEGFRNLAVTPAGQEIHLDEPVHFGGSGEAPDPAQYLLAAIGASLSVTLSAHAAMRDFVITSIGMRLSAKIDGRAFFSPGCGAPPGLLSLAIELRVQGVGSEAAFRELLADVLLATPVLQTLKQMPTVILHYHEDC